MNLLLNLIIQTANILGIFTDPFEFDGNYGPEVNPIRQKVFEQVVSKAALSKNSSDFEIKELMHDDHASKAAIDDFRNQLVIQTISKEKEYGPTLSQLVSPALIDEIKNKQIELQNKGFSATELEEILSFIEKYKEQKVFHFLRNNPPELLSLDKILKDKAAREGKEFDLPILGSMKLLEGEDSIQLKKNLIEAVFTKETLISTKEPGSIKQALSKLPEDYLKGFFGENANNQDLEIFSSSSGQLFFYWLYQSLNLDLIAIDPELIAQINKVKEIFSRTLGDSTSRANAFREKLIASDTSLLLTQESDAILIHTLTSDGLFLPIDQQNPKDGTFILLRSDMWEPDYEIITIENYEGFKAGRLNLILATQKESGQKFLLASGHGHSTNAEDGRLQMTHIMEKFRELSNGDLQLLIGIDANTKNEADVSAFRDHLENLGLIGTDVGPTTIKRRMVSAQHSKVGRFAIDEEDYLITLKSTQGGVFSFTNPTVGFSEEKPDINIPLPNIENPSDHYPVGATLTQD